MKSQPLRKGDVVVIWKLDKLGRNLKHLVELIVWFNEREIGLVSLNDPVDTTTAQGRLVFNIFAPLAEFERDVISERLGIARAILYSYLRHRGWKQEGYSEEKE